jgi:hypothetical protein
MQVAQILAPLAALPPITAFLALNFTGSSTFTSRMGVRREIYSYLPVMAGLLVLGIASGAAARIALQIGGS